MTKTTHIKRFAGAPLAAAGLFISLAPAYSQNDDEEEVFELSPFEVSSDDNQGYRATSTLAGTRLRTELKDVGSAIQAVTEEFMNDIGATDATTLLQYTTNTEVSGVGGNFAGTGLAQTPNEDARMRSPDSSTRVRGLQAADNARDFYQSVVPWDGYNVERVDIQRGANSILFGLGSPAGIVNADIIDANFGGNESKVGVRFDEHGSIRFTFDTNRVIIEDELSIRLAVLNENQKYQQKPAYEDDKRMFVAARYAPSFLNGDSAKTLLRAKYEVGDIERNSPRILPPVDRITPWFNRTGDNALNQVSVDPRVADDRASKRDGYGIAHRLYDDDTPNPFFNPWIGDMSQIYGGLIYVFDDPNSGNIQRVIDSTAKVGGGIGDDGSIDTTIDGIGNRRLRGVRGFSSYATEAGLPGANKGLYKDNHITDPSIFDFYNQLIEGPNKLVTADFDALNVSLEQTFFNNALGFELTHDEQTYEDEALTLLSDWRFSLGVDINTKLPNGETNPNYGRPFVSDSPWNNGSTGRKTVEMDRISAYYELDFNEVSNNDFVAKLFGRQIFNVAHSEQSSYDEDRRFQRAVTNSAYGERIGKADHRDNWRHSNFVTYLGPSLANRSSISGAEINPIGAVQKIVSRDATFFDSTWSPAAGINPGDAWTDPFNGNVLTQSENPANYVGWTQIPVGILDASNPVDRAKMYRELTINTTEVESDVAVWQGRFWNDSILPMLAYREDTVPNNVLNVKASLSTGDGGTIDDIDSLRPLSSEAQVEEGSRTTKGVVIHVDRLIGEDVLPVALSVFYNDSGNFNPGERRVDVFGNSIAPPSGDTEEYGFYIASKDNRFSGRFTWYETEIIEATNNVLSGNLWQLGVVENWALNQAFIIRDYPAGRADWEYMNQRDDETEAQWIQRRKDFTQVVFDNSLPREFHEAWGINNIYKADGTIAQFDGDGGVDLSSFYNRDETAIAPSGLVATSDTISSGLEIELLANPTDNWTIALNAAQTEAVFNNVGGVLAEYVESRGQSYQQELNGVRYGDFNVWGVGTGGSNTIEARDSDLFGSLELLKLQEGSATSELREWRANLVTKYSFNDGKFKGMNVGLGYRWQSKNTLGYGLTSTDEFDLDNPFEGPSEENIDLWIGYGKALTDSVDWYIQLNVSNAFQGDNLIPVTVQANGDIAGVRIGPSQSWFLQNTFEF